MSEYGIIKRSKALEKLIEEEESDILKPLEKRRSVLKYLLPKETFEKVEEILHLESEADEDEEDDDDDDEDGEIVPPAHDERESGDVSSREDTEYSFTTLSTDMVVNPPTGFNTEKGETESQRIKPYLNFLKKPDHLAASWRSQEIMISDPGNTDIVIGQQATLSQKARAVTKAITRDFCEWIRNLGGLQESTITEDILEELFQIGFDTPAARGLCVRVRELPVVTEKVAVATGVPEAQVRKGLLRQIRSDIKVESLPEKKVGFGRHLPYDPPLRFIPPRSKLKGNWIDCADVPTSISTMENVWGEILHLRSTNAFIKYMKDRPEIPRAEYLKAKGVFDGEIQSIDVKRKTNG